MVMFVICFPAPHGFVSATHGRAAPRRNCQIVPSEKAAKIVLPYPKPPPAFSEEKANAVITALASGLGFAFLIPGGAPSERLLFQFVPLLLLSQRFCFDAITTLLGFPGLIANSVSNGYAALFS